MPDLGRGMVIPSATSQTLQAALAAPSPNVLLTGVALDELPERAKQVLGAGKHAIVHADMTSGLHPNAAALSFLKDHCGVETIISTNAKVIETARRHHLQTVFRVFLLDSIALRTAARTLGNIHVDAVEILPGPMARSVIEHIWATGPDRTLLAGGFVRTSQLVEDLFRAGFDGVTTSYPPLWQRTSLSQGTR